jgi:nitrite reductase (NADH) large subunit
MTRYVIVGNGVAGTTAAEEIRKHDKNGSVTIVTDEDLPFYSRIRLPEYVAGEVEEDRLLIKKPAWYEKLKISLKMNTKIIGADSRNKILMGSGNEKISYDVLLIASGSHSFLPPITGLDRQGVFALRNISDARQISKWAQTVERVVLIGGGLLGLETGNALRKLGKKVTVVEFFPRLLPRQLDTPGAKRLQSMMEKMGFEFRLGAKTKEIAGDESVNGVILEDGELLPAGMVVISAGVRPNMELGEFLGLEKDKGIKVDERLRTNGPQIFAAGDVAEFNGMPYGIWPAATDQGKIAGANMVGETVDYRGTTMSNKLKVVGIDLASAGNIDADEQMTSKIVKSDDQYKKIVFEDNKIAGCIMLGDTRGFNRVVKAMTEKKDISAVKEDILSEGFDYQLI